MKLYVSWIILIIVFITCFVFFIPGLGIYGLLGIFICILSLVYDFPYFYKDYPHVVGHKEELNSLYSILSQELPDEKLEIRVMKNTRYLLLFLPSDSLPRQKNKIPLLLVSQGLLEPPFEPHDRKGLLYYLLHKYKRSKQPNSIDLMKATFKFMKLYFLAVIGLFIFAIIFFILSIDPVSFFIMFWSLLTFYIYFLLMIAYRKLRQNDLISDLYALEKEQMYLQTLENTYNLLVKQSLSTFDKFFRFLLLIFGFLPVFPNETRINKIHQLSKSGIPTDWFRPVMPKKTSCSYCSKHALLSKHCPYCGRVLREE